jgi:nuclear transport factor 2 (NTF2) superfamily protein
MQVGPVARSSRQVIHFAKGNPIDKPIAAGDRKFLWPKGRRPDDHLGPSEVGL